MANGETHAKRSTLDAGTDEGEDDEDGKNEYREIYLDKGVLAKVIASCHAFEAQRECRVIICIIENVSLIVHVIVEQTSVVAALCF